MISFQIAGIILIVIILVFYLSQKRLALKSGQLFVIAAILVSLIEITDIASIYFSIDPNISEFASKLLCKLYLVMLAMISTLGLIYIARDVYKYDIKVRKMTAISIISTAAIATILILVSDISYVYKPNENIFYTEGTSCLICYATCGIFLIATIILSIIKRNEIQRGRKNTIIVWMAIWIIAAVVQFIFKQILIVSFASSIGLVIIYIMLENPALAIDKETSCFNKALFDEYMIELFESRKSFKLVYVILHANDVNIDYKKKALINLSDILSGYSNKKIFTARNNYLTFRNEYGFVVVLKNVEINDFFQKFNNSLIEYNKKYEKAYNIKYLLFDNSGLVNNYIEFKSLMKEVIDNSDIITYKNDKYYVDSNTIKRIEDNIIMEGIIKYAIDNDLVEVYLQPIYSKEKKSITSAEALIRIKDQAGNIIYPNSFIELAEKNGTISILGEKVFIHVCKFLNENNISDLGLDYIEINLSVVQCGDPNLALKYIEIMKEYNINPKQINLEITETASTNLRNIMIDNMNKLIQYGINFSLDDFGMGNSNLNYIIEMPVEIVKFDRTLVLSYFNDSKAKLVITRIIEMIKALNLEIVLEGIETIEELEEVLKLDIDFIQGYYFSKPICSNEFIEYVKNYNKK